MMLMIRHRRRLPRACGNGEAPDALASFATNPTLKLLLDALGTFRNESGAPSDLLAPRIRVERAPINTARLGVQRNTSPLVN